MKLASLAFLCMTMPILALAQDSPIEKAKIVLVAPDSARVGELVRFDVSASVADSFEWLVVPLSQDFEVYADGRRAVFSARAPGEYRFIVACAKDGTVNVVTHVIKVLGPPTSPVTDSLAEWIPFWLWNMDLPKEEAEALAASFEGVADLAPETPEEWIKLTAESNREALGARIEVWKPLMDKIGTTLLKMAQDGRLMTPEQHAAVWREIAAGLRRG